MIQHIKTNNNTCRKIIIKLRDNFCTEDSRLFQKVLNTEIT